MFSYVDMYEDTDLLNIRGSKAFFVPLRHSTVKAVTTSACRVKAIARTKAET